MSTLGPTPPAAPWTVHHDERSASYSVYNGAEPIAHLFYDRTFPEVQEAQRVKAHMIAASPALVEALERLTECAREGSGRICPDCLAAGVAALAAARAGEAGR